VEHIDLVARPVREPALRILAMQYEPPETSLVYPGFPLDETERRVLPPRVAHVGQLLGATVEAALASLTLMKPHSEFIMVKRGIPTEPECAYTAEDVGSVRLSVRLTSKRAIVVSASFDECDSLLDVDTVACL
jgi:hypothetical protein